MTICITSHDPNNAASVADQIAKPFLSGFYKEGKVIFGSFGHFVPLHNGLPIHGRICTMSKCISLVVLDLVIDFLYHDEERFSST